MTWLVDCEILGVVIFKQVKLPFFFNFYKLFYGLHRSKGLLLWQRRNYASKVVPIQGLLKPV